jgi:hypothetical protein
MAVNVRDFAAAGDGVADDTAAIQHPLDLNKSIAIPPGTYRTTAPITFHDALRVSITGEPGATTLIGNFPGYVLDRDTDIIPDGPFRVQGLTVINHHPQGGGIRIGGSKSIHIQDCLVAANAGCIAVYHHAFGTHIERCQVRPTGGVLPGSIGILSGGHAQIMACDVIGLDHGIRACGGTVNIQGCRLEVNNYGIVCGANHLDENWYLNGSAILGCSFEANDTAIWCRCVASSKFGGLIVQGTTNAPSGYSNRAMLCGSMEACEVSACLLSGGFDIAAVDITPYTLRTAFVGVQAGNIHPTAPPWSIPAGFPSDAFIQCNQP